ncbi:MAG: hypothetical protein K8T89_00645, partial [Planctomycetes bacterium]|nr:hypothetical protein [Planctomycetota bacterium]
MKRTPLLVFADDWGRHPSSCQHLVKQMLDAHPTTWVNTIGTRTPKFDLATVRRGLGKVRGWLPWTARAAGASQNLPRDLTVLNPRMWPWFTRKIDRWLNRKLLLKQLRPVVEAMAEPPVAVTTLPIVADLMPHLPVNSWAYYCVDDFSKWPGLDRKTMARLERLVVDRADTIVAASEHLQERLRRMGRDAELLTHGVDVNTWQITSQEHTIVSELPKPLVVFWGVIDRRLDVACIRQLAATMTEGTVLLVGPQQDADPELDKLTRVVRPGPVPFEQLPAIAHEASVLIMPYANLPVTRAMQPLKLKEYLAT